MVSRRAFSLVELSIVLVILGLLVGGILSGQSLIRASELRAASTEYQKYIAAIHAFRDKYFALPGDMPNAQSFWGVQHATPATCKTTPSTSALTCNGDGDGMISAGAVGSNEHYRAWQHLANAGLIEGQYGGIATTNYVPPAVPYSRLSNSIWFIDYGGPRTATVDYFAADYGHEFQFFNPGGAPWANVAPEEAWNIDTKLDDGKPGTGKIISWKGNATRTCTSVANSVTDTGAVYSLTNTGKDCWFFFARILS